IEAKTTIHKIRHVFIRLLLPFFFECDKTFQRVSNSPEQAPFHFTILLLRSTTFSKNRAEESGLACFLRPSQDGGLPFRQLDIQQTSQHLNYGHYSCLVNFSGV
ncbi:MAG: hypothetical protein WBM78_05330, partial [Desulfobacterales bacterium]